MIDRGAARRVRQVIPAPRAAPVLQLHQFGHEGQAVRCPRHNLVVILAITITGAERPAAEPLPGRHRQPAHTAPASLRRHEVKLTRRSDITAVADDERGSHRDGRRSSNSYAPPASRPSTASGSTTSMPFRERPSSRPARVASTSRCAWTRSPRPTRPCSPRPTRLRRLLQSRARSPCG